MDALSVVQYCCLSDKINYYRLIDYRCAKYPRQSTYILINIPSPRFPSILRTTHGRNDPKCGMLMYPGHPQNWFDFGQYWPNFDPLVAKKLSEIGVSQHSKGNAWKDWPEMWHADVSWPVPEMIFGQNWPDFDPLVAKKLNEIGVYGQSNVNAWKAWPEMWHAGVSWPPPEMIRFYSVLV